MLWTIKLLKSIHETGQDMKTLFLIPPHKGPQGNKISLYMFHLILGLISFHQGRDGKGTIMMGYHVNYFKGYKFV